MIHRKGIPDNCKDKCSWKEKFQHLWDRTIGSIIRINGITPDGDGDFSIEAGTNIALSESGTGNGIRIDTTGGVSYYTTDDPKLSIDNSDLKISTVGLALQDDLDTVAQAAVDNATDIGHIVDGTTLVGRANVAVNAQDASHATTADNATNATNASNIVSSSTSIGDSTHPVYVQNGQAVAMSDAVVTASGSTATNLSLISPTFSGAVVTNSSIRFGSETNSKIQDTSITNGRVLLMSTYYNNNEARLVLMMATNTATLMFEKYVNNVLTHQTTIATF